MLRRTKGVYSVLFLPLFVSWLAVSCLAFPLAGEEVSTERLFAESRFDQWKAEGPKEQIPWKVHLLPARLSIHQRLEIAVEVLVPGSEIVRRRADGQLVMLVQIADLSGQRYRNHGILELGEIKPEVAKADAQFFWEAFVLPGEYEVSLALYDKVTGEHSFVTNTTHVVPLRNDPLPNLWLGLPKVEFWAPEAKGLDRIYRTDTRSRLHLPLITRRPLHLEVIADLTPTDLFGGDYGAYQNYLHGVLPLMKALSQVKVSNGSVSLAALDLDQRQVNVDQPNLEEIDWPSLKAAVGPSHGPGVVAVRNLLERKHSPAFLREELIRRMNAVPNSAAPAGQPLPVFVVITAPMDPYSFSN